MNPQYHKHHRPNTPHSVWVKAPAPKWFFHDAQSRAIRDTIRPWEPFIVEETMRLKKSFPFLTPNQALKKYLALPEDRVKPLEKWTLRVIPLGWCEQVGLNSMIFEYEDEVLIIDMGLQFPDQYQYGINSSIPDLT